MIMLYCIVVVILVTSILYYLPLAQVVGSSMFPTLQDKDIILTTRVFRLKPSCIYVYKHGDKLVIKRLDHVTIVGGRSYCFFLGDNPDESNDSRYYGYVNAENIIAKVLWHVKH